MRFFDRNGMRLGGLFEWARLMEDPEYRFVAHTRITSATDAEISVDVYSSWLGLETARIPGDTRPALIFETWAHYHRENEVTCDRWASESATRIGHAELVALCGAMFPAPVLLDLDAFGRPAGPDDWVGAPLPQRAQ